MDNPKGKTILQINGLSQEREREIHETIFGWVQTEVKEQNENFLAPFKNRQKKPFTRV